MISKNLGWLLATVLLATAPFAQAQQPTKISRIGYLVGVSPSDFAERSEAFRQGLRELGYVEGKNIVIESRYAEGKFDRLPALAAELVALKVDVIVTGGTSATKLVKQITDRIPIVMPNDDDPVGNGFVASLARPGGNITGLATLRAELSGKRLEVLTEILPKLSRLTVLGVPTEPGNAESLKQTEIAAKGLRVQIQYLDVLSGQDIETAFQTATKARAEAVFLLGGPIFVSQRRQIAEFALKSRLPTMSYSADFVEDGGLVSYAPSVTDLSRRAAVYVDKILKGTKPADLPVEQPTKFESSSI